MTKKPVSKPPAKPAPRSKPATTGALLFGPMEEAERPKRATDAKAIADRAAATSSMTRRAAERQAAAADGIDLKPLPDPIDADEYFAHASAWISGAADFKLARKRWDAEGPMRVKLEVTVKQVRLLEAGLTGRCRRLGEPV